MIASGISNTFDISSFKSLNQEAVIAFYFDITFIPIVICSPLRVDRHPSFSIYKKDGEIRYIDYANPTVKGDILDLLCAYFKAPLPYVLEQIELDLPKIIANEKKVSIIKELQGTNYESVVKIEIVPREWKKHDIIYWESQGISKETAIWGGITPLWFFHKIENGNYITIPASRYSYAYKEEKDGVVSYKIYQPFNSYLKWMSTHNSSVWDLWEKLPEKGDKLIITKSRKDALCIIENTGIPACGLQSESIIPKAHIIDLLRKRFTHIYVLFDNDYNKVRNWGKEAGHRICTMYNLMQIEIPTQYSSSDSAELFEKVGKEKFKKIITDVTKYPIKP